MISPAARSLRQEAAPRCAVTARDRGDQLFGTAAPGQRWLLIEHPGPWPRRAFETSSALREVAARAVRDGVRAVLIRRPGRPRAAPSAGLGASSAALGRPAPRAWAYVDARPGGEGAWWSEYSDERELLEVPLVAGSARSTEPIHLVCAHGKHDTCCAVEGRPVAAALAAVAPAGTWECSHIGGDRFAPNLVVLPHGFYYGNLDPASAVGVIAAYRAGAVVPELLRGRSAFPPAVQAAQHYARSRTGVRGIDVLDPLGVERLDERATRVTLATVGERAIVATVRAGWSAPAILSCAAGRPERARHFDLIDYW